MRIICDLAGLTCALALLASIPIEKAYGEKVHGNEIHGAELHGAISPRQTATNFLNSVPLKRYIRPDEVAQLAVFLGTDEASYVNGQS